MSCDNNKDNKGCRCHNNPSPELPEVADMSMNVCDRNLNMLPMLQTYITKVLKPNVHCKKNILTQQMMNCECYKYVIKWDFDLNGKTITVPSNCILEFDGGSLKNGTIVGQDTLFINVGDVDIWGENLTREGTWREKQGNGGGIPDKEYDPEHNSGLGRKTLELDGGSNILTQDDFDQENTIYVITYDFDLNGGTIEIPEGCILDFEGGSVNNGKLLSNRTVLSGTPDNQNCLLGVYYDELNNPLNYNKIRTKKWDTGFLHGIFLAEGAIVDENLMCQSIAATENNVFVLCGTAAADSGTEPYYPVILVYDKYFNYIGKTRTPNARTHMNDVACDDAYLYVTGTNIIYKYSIETIVSKAERGENYTNPQEISFAHNPAILDYDPVNEEFFFGCNSYMVVTDKNLNEIRRVNVDYNSGLEKILSTTICYTGCAYKNGVAVVSLWGSALNDLSTDEGGNIIVSVDTITGDIVDISYANTGFNYGEVEGFFKDPNDSNCMYVLYYSSNSETGYFRTVVIAKVSQVKEVYGVNKKFGKAESKSAQNRFRDVVIDNNEPEVPAGKTKQEVLNEIGFRDGSANRPFTSFEAAYLLSTGDIARYHFGFIASNTPYFIGKHIIEAGNLLHLRTRGEGRATLFGGIYLRGGKASMLNVIFNAYKKYVVNYRSCISTAQTGDLYLEGVTIDCAQADTGDQIHGVAARHSSRLHLLDVNISSKAYAVSALESFVVINGGTFTSTVGALYLELCSVRFHNIISINAIDTGIISRSSFIAHSEHAITISNSEYAIDTEKSVWKIYPDNIHLSNCNRFIRDHDYGYGIEFTVNSYTISHLLELLSVGANSASVLVHMQNGVAGYSAGDYYWNGSMLVSMNGSSSVGVISGIENMVNRAEECPVGPGNVVNSGIWSSPDDNIGLMSHVDINDAPISSVSGGINISNSSGDSNSLTGAKTNIGIVDAKTYSASCLVKGNGKLRFMVGRDAAEPVYEDYIRSEIVDVDSTSYIYVSLPLHITQYVSEKPSVNMYAYLVGQGNITICFPKLEKGNASDFAYFKSIEGTESYKILSLGDSIMRGWRNNNLGFMKYISPEGGYKNISVSGATLSNSYSEVKNIPQQLIDEAASVNPYDPDVIIANGGVNDYYRGIQLGSASSSPVTDSAGDSALNKSTVLGALEHLFYKMTELFPQARRFFMLSHKILDWSTTQNSAGYTFEQLNNAIESVCTLYGVTYIDVYGTSEIDTSNTKYKADIAYDDTKSAEWKKNWNDDNYVDSDGIHPADYGYKVGYAPIIREAIGNTANSIYDKGYIDDSVNKAQTALQLSDFDEKSAAGISQTSSFDKFAIVGIDKDGNKYKFNRGFLNEFVRQTRSPDHFSPDSNVDTLVRPGIFYGSLNPVPSIFNDSSASSKYHHILIDGDNDVFQIVYRNDHNTLGIRNGSQSGYSKALKPLRTPLVINSATGTSITAYVNNLYRFDSTVSNLTITLPNTDLLYADKVEFVFTTDSNPSITFAEPNSNPIVYQTGYNIEASKTYRITAEWIGNKWIVSYITIS